jgi:membrane-bound lytic murein transglycosylase D
MAAYNMGYAGLTRAIRKFSSNDFWELARYEAGLPWETTLYVPKIVATAVVMNNPGAFGLGDVTPDPAESFDTVLVSPGTPLDAVARAAGVPLETIERLNPQFLAGRTPPAAPGTRGPGFRVRVPLGKGSGTARLLASAGPELDGVLPYVVRQGDTVETIASAAGTSEAKVRGLNRVGSQEVLAPGTVLLVPEPERPPVQLASLHEEVVVVSRNLAVPAGSERVFYRVVSGDTLTGIAASFATSRSELLTWNALDESARLVPGMTLQLFVKQGQTTSARCLHQREARVLVAGTAEFFDYFEGLNGRKRIVVNVREGDTLASIGRRYGMTVGWMERVNRRSRSDRLDAGETIVVYTDKPGVQPVRPELSASALALPALPRSDALPPSEGVAAEAALPEAAVKADDQDRSVQ